MNRFTKPLFFVPHSAGRLYVARALLLQKYPDHISVWMFSLLAEGYRTLVGITE